MDERVSRSFQAHDGVVMLFYSIRRQFDACRTDYTALDTRTYEIESYTPIYMKYRGQFCYSGIFQTDYFRGRRLFKRWIALLEKKNSSDIAIASPLQRALLLSNQETS